MHAPLPHHLLFPDFYDYPLSTDALLGHSSEFFCYGRIWVGYRCYRDYEVAVNWLINGSSYNTNTTITDYYDHDESTYSNEDGSINFTTLHSYDLLYSTLYIRATIANSSTEIQCEIEVIGCPDESRTSPTAVLNVQG